jgi:hypothetical protein
MSKKAISANAITKFAMIEEMIPGYLSRLFYLLFCTFFVPISNFHVEGRNFFICKAISLVFQKCKVI